MAYGSLDKWAIEYRLGEVAWPKMVGSKLFVYATLKEAYRQFRRGVMGRYAMLLCEVGELIRIDQPITITAPWYASFGWRDGQLQHYPGAVLDSVHVRPEDGFGLASWVKPLKEVTL